jgi:hypothetical protein
VIGATGRGGTSVRGLTTGGGEDEVGRPSASRNLRICSSCESLRVARGNSGGVDVDLRLVSSRPLFDFVVARASNWNSSATPAKTQNSQLS